MVEHLFRHEAGKIVATLTRSSAGTPHAGRGRGAGCAGAGTSDLAAFTAMPENPSAWIMRASRNLALDVVRRVSNDPQSGIMGEGEHVKPSSHLA
jgi:RNA polymerase sigma-70 factor (ECF subfamily)